jgi:hypothetical protein
MPVRVWNSFIPFVSGTCLCNLVIIIMKEWHTRFISRLTVFNIIKYSVCMHTFLNLFNWTVNIGLPKILILLHKNKIMSSLHIVYIQAVFVFYFNLVQYFSKTYETCLSKLTLSSPVMTCGVILFICPRRAYKTRKNWHLCSYVGRL